MKLFMNALFFAPSDDVPASLAEAIAIGYNPEVAAKEASTDDKDGTCCLRTHKSLGVESTESVVRALYTHSSA